MDSRAWSATRRDFLQVGFGGLIGLILAGRMDPLLLAQAKRKRAKACVLLWMAGGPSQLDTFDPKPGKETGGPFKDIETAVPGIRISEHLSSVAQQMRHLAIIRSMTTKEGNHDRATYLVHTGYPPQVTVPYPSLGAIVSFERGNEAFDLPNFVSIGGPSVEAGYLGHKYNPFVIKDPAKPPENLSPSGGSDVRRLNARLDLLADVDREFANSLGASQSKAHQEVYTKASRMMRSSLLNVFDISQEKESVQKTYGATPFGQGCLLARRLVEAGVPFVEVTLPGWDTHRDNFDGQKRLMGQLDPAFAALIKDLNERRLLEETLVVWMGEFGRTPRINGNGGRDHYPKAWTVVLAGGGVQGGKVIGSTDELGVEIKDRPVKISDLFASIAHTFGIDYGKSIMTPLGRPITLVDKEGQLIEELFK